MKSKAEPRDSAWHAGTTMHPLVTSVSETEESSGRGELLISTKVVLLRSGLVLRQWLHHQKHVF